MVIWISNSSIFEGETSPFCVNFSLRNWKYFSPKGRSFASIPQTSDNKLIVTGKIFDYIGAQVPILCIGPPSGDAVSIIRQLNIGMYFDHNDSLNLQKWLETNVSERKIPYNSWRTNFKNHPYSRFSLSRKIATLLIN